MEKIFDVIIIGGGPSGTSAALYAVRGGLSVAIVHNGVSALHKAERIENYYGVGAVSGEALYSSGIKQAQDVGATVIADQVTFVSFDGEHFSVTAVGGEYRSKRLVIATGAERRRADIDGLSEFEGKGVSYCAVCDAFFYRKKRVGVIGAGDFAEHEYNTLKAVANEVYLLTNGEKPTFAADKTVESKISRIFGNDSGRFGGIAFSDGATLELDGLFIALGVMGSAALCKSMGVFTDRNGAVITDARGMTNIDGLYAAGDCTAGIRQVGKAVADGVTVGMSLIADLKSDRKSV